jgi:hypothetical protein
MNSPDNPITKPCKHETLCPFKIRPQVGMWAKVGDIQFWGTDCLAYLNCSRHKWTKIQWKQLKENPNESS